MERGALNAERIRVWEFGIFDQAQVQDRESSHYGLWQISIESNEKLLYNSAKQNWRQHKYTGGFWQNSECWICQYYTCMREMKNRGLS